MDALAYTGSDSTPNFITCLACILQPNMAFPNPRSAGLL